MSDQTAMSEEAWDLFQEKLTAKMEQELAAAPRGNIGIIRRRVVLDKYRAAGLGQPAPSTQQQAPSQEELRQAYEAEIEATRSRIGWSKEQAIEIRAKFRKQGLQI